MADQQRRVSLIFDADSDRAKQQIDSLVSSINKLMNRSMRSTGVAGLDKDLQEATKNAAQLQIQLQKAVNVKTGKLDLTKFNDSLRESGMTLDKYQQSFSKVGSVGQQAFTGLARSIATAEIPLRRTNSLLNDFAVTMKNTVKWQLSSSIMHGFLSSIQSAMSYAQHLNQNLTDIRIVAGQSADEMARFAEVANKSAKELSTTTNQYTQAALIFYQQGLNDKEVKKRTDAVIKMANATGEAAKDVSSYMTAIWNNFDDGSKSLEYYADVITKLGAATAASSEEIAGGLEKFAAVGNTIGLSYEYATAMLTTIIDKTRQSEDVVGTALKTILARIQGLNLGETLDDGTTLNKYSAALASVGVQIKDASGQLRDMDAILNDLGGKWQSLSKDTQVALAQVVGGVRQYNQIISLMDNWDAFEMNLDIAFNAEGELNKQAEIYAESWEAAQKRVQAALESIYSALIDDTFFIKMNDMFAGLLDIVKQFIDGIGGASGLLTGMGSILLTVFGSQVTTSLKNLTNNIRMLTKTGREELVSIQKQAQNLLSQQDYGKGVGAKGIKSAYESEARAQLALLNNAKKLTEEEQAIANILMQQHHVRVDEQVALGNQLNELEKIEQRQIGIFDSAKDKLTDMLASEGDSSSLKHSFSWIDDISQEIILLQDDFGSLSAAIDGAFGTGEGGASVAAQRLLNNLDNIKVSSPEAKRALEEFKNAMTQAGTDATAQSQAFNNLELALGEMGQTISDNKKQVLELFNNMRQAAQGNEELTRAINVAEQAYRNYINTSERVQNTKQELITANGRVIASEEAVQSVLKASGAIYLSTQQSIVAVAQIASTLGSIFNTFKGLRESIKEGNVSFGQLLTTFGFLIPQILSLIGNFKNLTMTTYGAIAAGKLFSTEKLAEAAAINVSKGAVVGFSTALKTSLPVYALITGAVIGLIAVVKSFIKLMNEPTAYEKHVEEIKKLNEQIEENKEKAETATESVKNLYEEFANYTDAVDALNKLTKGTEAWNEQLISTKNLANVLLDSMPILADIVANPQKYGMVGKIRDENGNFTQEVLDLAFNTQRDQESLIVYSNAFSQREAAQTREIESEQGAMLRGEEYTNIGSENYVGASGAYERDIWTTLAPLMPELVKLYNPQMTSDSQLVSGATLLEAIKNSPAYFENSAYTEEGRFLVNSLIYGAQTSNLPGTYDPAYSTVNANLSNLPGLDIASNGIITVNEAATPEEIDDIITTTMGTIVDTEATGFLNVLAKDYSNMVEPVIINQIGEKGSQTYFDYAGELAAYNMDFNSDQTENNETFTRVLGNYIAEQIDTAYDRGEYSNLTSEDFAKAFGIEGAKYDPISDTLTYNNPKAGQEGEEDTITINNARDTYAYKSEVEKLGYIYGDYYKAAATLGYENPALVGRLFENKGSLTGFSTEEVEYLSSTDLSSYLPDTVKATLEAIEEKGLQDRDYSIGEAIVNTSSDLPYPIKSLLNDSEMLSSLTDEDLSLILGQDYNSDSGLLRAAEAIRSIESADLSHIADDLERGVAPAKAYESMAGNMSEIAEVAKKLQEGESITEKEYGVLDSAGIDLSNVYRSGTTPGEYEGTVDISSILDTMLQTQNLGELFNLETGEGLTLDTKKAILEYLGYNLVGYTNREIPRIFSQVSDDTLRYIDTYHIGEEVANFIGVLGFGAEKYLGEYSDKYTTAMAQAQAKLDGKDWDTLLAYAGENGITSQEDYNAAVTNLNRQTGTNELVASANSWIKQIGSIINREDFDSIIQGEKFGDSLKNLMEALSLILGFEVDIDFIKKNWDIIDNLTDGDQSSRTMSVLHNYGIKQGYLTGEAAITTMPSDYATYGAQLDYANLQEAAQIKAGDIYSQGALAILDSFDVQEGFRGVNRNLFDIALQDANLWNPTGGVDGKGAIADEELFKKWLDESGMVQFTTTDEEGNVIELETPKVLDEELIAAGYDTVEEIIALFTGAMIAGAGEYDINSSGFDKAVRDVYSGMDLASQEANGLKIWATKDQMKTGANALNNAYTSGGVRGLSQVATWLEDAGAKAPQLAAALANIDWSASNAFDLASAALSDAGLSADDYTDALNSVISATQVAVDSLTTLAEAIGIFSSKTGLADKIRAGESFTEDEYNQLVNQYGEKTARGMVSRQADGSYMYTGYDPSQVATELEQQSISGFQEVQQTNQAFLDDSSNMNDNWTFLDAGWLEYLANSNDANGNNLYGFNEEQQKAMLQYGGLQSDEERQSFANSDLMSTVNGKAIDWDAIRALAEVNASRNVEESGEMITNAEERIPRENWEKEVSDLGLDVEETDKLGDSIQQMAEGMSEAELEAMGLSKALADNEELADKLAKKVQRYNRAVDKITDSYEDWKKAISSEDWEESSEAISEVKDTVEDMLDLPMDALDDLALNAEDATEMLELMDKAAAGDIDAYNELQSVVAEDIMIGQGAKVDPALQSALDTISSEVDNLPVGLEQPFMIGEGSAVSQDLYDSMNAVLAATAALGGDVEGNMKAVAEAMGMDVEVETKTFDVNVLGPTYKPGDPIYDEATGITYTPVTVGTNEESGTVTGVAIKAITNKGSSFGGSVGTRGGSGSRPRRGGGGGGRRDPGKKKGEKDKDRYHVITNQIEDLTDALEKVDKATDRAFGRAKVKLLEEQEKALSKLIVAQQDYIKEIEDYLSKDKDNLYKNEFLSGLGIDLQFDENGTIVNYEELEQKMIDDYNKMRKKYKKGKISDDEWEEYQEKWDKAKELLDQYEDTQDLLKDANQELLDLINQVHDNRLLRITILIEADLSTVEYALDIIDYKLNKIEDDAWKAAESLALLGEQMNEYARQGNAYETGIREIFEKYTEDITVTDPETGEERKVADALLTQAEVDRIMAGNLDPNNENDQVLLDKIGQFTEEDIETLKEYHNGLIETNRLMLEARENVYATLVSSFQQFNEELDAGLEKMRHLTSMLNHYRNIADIVGNENLGISDEMMNSLGQTAVDMQINELGDQKNNLDALKKAEGDLRNQIDALKATGVAEDTAEAERLEKEVLGQIQEDIRTAEEDFMGSWEDTLNSINEQFANAVATTIKRFSDTLAGPLAGSLEELQENFQRATTLEEAYLPDYEKIYELNKLNRDITNSIDETDNVRSKQLLAELQSEINALQEDGVKLSQYETENLRRKYELRLAESALTEAQNAKSQVQMQRDASGNWSYVYTANEEDVAEAEQNYEDKLFAMQQANGEYINELQDSIITLQSEMTSSIETIMNDETLSMEERMIKVDETSKYYSDLMDIYSDQLQIALGENGILYEQDWQRYSELTGYKISKEQDFIDKFGETKLAQLTGFRDLQDLTSNFKDATAPLYVELTDAIDQWRISTENAFSKAGTSMTDYSDTLTKEKEEIEKKHTAIEQDTADLAKKVTEEYKKIVDEYKKWYENYGSNIDKMVEENQKLIDSYADILKYLTDIKNSGLNPGANDPVTSPETDPGDDDPDGDDPNGDEDERIDKAEANKQNIALAILFYKKHGWGKKGAKKIERFEEKGMDGETVLDHYRSLKNSKTFENKKEKRKFAAHQLGIKTDKSNPDWRKDTKEKLKQYKYKKFAFATGGYTGSWGSEDEGRFALLHEKELVLNKTDTENFLSAIDILRQVSEAIDLNAVASSGFGATLTAGALKGNAGTLEQNVHITAEFPNATNRTEIYEAFNDIINLASQYSNRK